MITHEGYATDGQLLAETRPIVLILIGSFWPGNDASGANQSIAALTSALGDHFQFRLIARDRPLGATVATAACGDWIDLGTADIRYCNPGLRGLRDLRQLLTKTRYDILWLNGFFDREFTLKALILRRLGLIPNRPVLLSPRGEFGAGALELKAARKKCYLVSARFLGLLSRVVLHATTEIEAGEMAAHLPSDTDIVVAPNIRVVSDVLPFDRGDGSRLRVSFVGRITPKKKLDYALHVLKRISVPVLFNIFGPPEDEMYWNHCQTLIRDLPAHVGVVCHGALSVTQIVSALAKTDLFFLPTANENFGHAIFEALSCGVPILISDQTPWRNLAERQAGWDLPLEDPGEFARIIEAVALMPAEQRQKLREGARLEAESRTRNSRAAERSAHMLHSLVGG